MSQERTPILGREVSKPLRPEEYPSEKEIASLTGEIGASRLETVLRTMGIAAPVLAVPILVTACQEIPETPAIVRTPEEAGVTPSPILEIKTPTPTEEVIPPTPTVVQREIGTIPRELGGAESEIFSVSHNGEIQRGVLNKFPDGEQWFLLGVYPDLPGVEEKVDFTNEEVGYDGEVFLTAVPGLEDHPNARPFYQKEPEEGFPNGVLLYLEDGEVVGRVDPFIRLQEGEASVRFNSEKGVYEFLDEEENVKRTIEVFTVPALTPTPTKEPTPTPEKPVEMVATGNVDLYLSPDGQKVGYFVPGQRFTPTGKEQNGWIQVRDSDANILWIQEGGPYGPAGEATPVPEVTPLPEHPFCPEIPPGFWNPYGGPPQANIQRSRLWEYLGDYQYSLYGQIIDQGRRNADGSISTRIKINLSGTGLLEAEYILPPGLPIRRIMTGKDWTEDTITAPYISPEEVCLEDIVIITSISSPDVLDPRIPGPHVLDGPFYIRRYLQ